MPLSFPPNSTIIDTSYRSMVHTTTPGAAFRTKQASLAAFEASANVLELSNRGCEKISIRDYPEANRLFELALSNHLIITESSSSPVSSYDCGIADSYSTENGNNDDDITLDLDFDFEVESDDRCEGVDDIEDYYDDDCDSCESSIFIDESIRSKDLAVSFNTIFTPDGPSTDIRRASVDSSSSTTSTGGSKRLQQMTASSTLPICSFYGQHHASNKYHEVYCSTIVMNDLEWRSAQAEAKTFVLLYNAALCSHLWGMDLQQYELQGKTLEPEKDKQSRSAFLVADQLYRLALNHATTVGNIPFDHGIDFRLCVVALLNNLCHITKTHAGINSPEALQMDMFLLKAIFWWRDSRRTAVASSTDANNSDVTYHHTHNDRGDANAEIVDLFLEHVFYLIGAQESFACAATA